MSLIAHSTKILFAAYRAMPPSVRYGLKKMARMNGHTSSPLDRLKAIRDAHGKKRLDRAFADIVRRMDLCGIGSLEGKRCLEIGGGFVITDAICFHLMGAQMVLSTDYNRIAEFSSLEEAIRTCDRTELVKSACKWMKRETFEQRLAVLEATFDGTEESLRGLGIHYLAPVDLTTWGDPSAFDLIYSVSVFEHISPAVAAVILRRMAARMPEDGAMIHEIHLEDHLDFDDDPFGFLRRNTKYDAVADLDGRGNRLRASAWIDLLAELDQVSTSIAARWVRETHLPLAEELLPEYAQLSPIDCFTSKILTHTRRRPNSRDM